MIVQEEMLGAHIGPRSGSETSGKVSGRFHPPFTGYRQSLGLLGSYFFPQIMAHSQLSGTHSGCPEVLQLRPRSAIDYSQLKMCH